MNSEFRINWENIILENYRETPFSTLFIKAGTTDFIEHEINKTEM